MADTFYCDHGAYSGTITFTGSVSGQTLTVTGTTTGGPIVTGMTMVLNGQTCWIQSFGAGTNGGAGTYTLSAMGAAGYTGGTVSSTTITGDCRTGCSLATIPVWGVPQEGDGLAKTASTSVPTAFIKFSATPTVGATPNITVMGVQFTTLTTLTGAGSANAAADALATLINASVVTVPTGISNTTPKLRDLVYARGPTNGAATGCCEIMSRVGSVRLNYSFNSQCLISSFNVNNVSSTATQQQFAGGTSGCFGTILNPHDTLATASGAYIVATNTYGVFGYSQRPLGGFMGQAGDITYIRGGKLINSLTGTSGGATLTNVGTTQNPNQYIIDDGTQWPADAGLNLIVDIRYRTTAYLVFNGLNQGNFACAVRAKLYRSGPNAGQRSLQFNVMDMPNGGGSSDNMVFRLPSSQPVCRWENVAFDVSTYSGAATTGGIGIGSGGSYQSIGNAQFSTYVGCLFRHKGTAQFFTPTNTNPWNAQFESCVFSNLGATVANLGIINSGSSSAWYMLNNCRFEDFVIGSRLSTINGVLASNATVSSNFALRDCDMGNVTNRGPFAPNSAGSGYRAAMAVGYVMTTIKGKQEFAIDTQMGFIEWNASRSQPTLNALCRDGITPMSWRFVPPTAASNNACGCMTPFESPRILKVNTLGQTAATFTVEILLEETLTWTTKDIWLVLEYDCAQTGKREYLDSFNIAGAALTASTAPWSSIVFNDGGNLNHNKYKFSVSTPTGFDLAANADIVASFRIAGTTSQLTKGGFIDPEIVVS